MGFWLYILLLILLYLKDLSWLTATIQNLLQQLQLFKLIFELYFQSAATVKKSGVLSLLLHHFLSPQHTRMEQPGFPEHLHNSHQTSHIPPPTNRAGHLMQPCQNLALTKPPEPRPTASSTRRTWTSLMYQTRACLGKKAPLVKNK